MTRPSIYSFVTGSIPMRIFVYGFTALCLWADLRGLGSGALTVIMLLMSAACVHAAKTVAAYRQWKWEWDAMAGIVRPPTLLQRWPWLVKVGQHALWFAILVAAVTVLPHPLDVIVARVFILVWAVMFARWVGRCVRDARRRRGERQVSKDCFVTVCLPVAERSPNYQAVLAALPDYSRALIERSA